MQHHAATFGQGVLHCLRVAGIAGVVGEVSKLSTTASKRLQLAAEGSGVTAFILRRAAKADALIEGYCAVRPLSDAERAALPVLARGAAMRFMMTRAYDWLHTPADALVTRKDPMDFARRLHFYTTQADQAFPALQNGVSA